MADNFQITQGSGTTIAAHDNGTALEQQVQVTNFPATQPVSAVSLPLPSGASTESTLSTLNGKVTAVNTGAVTISSALPTGTNVIGHVITDSGSTTAVTGNVEVTNDVGNPLPVNGTVAATQSGTWTVQPGNTANTTPWLVSQVPSNLIISATAATGVAVTATLPAVASQFHYITLVEILKYFTAANAASATPLVVTTTNLPGSLAWSFGQPLGTIGTTAERSTIFNAPLKSSTVNTATTIVCPATTGIIWRVNVYYYSAV